jgi:hypothetical protein
MDFTSYHIWEEDPLVLVRTYYHSLLVFFSNDLLTVRFDEMVTVIKHPLETRKKRMVKKLELYTFAFTFKTKIKNISAQRGRSSLLLHHEQIHHHLNREYGLN